MKHYEEVIIIWEEFEKFEPKGDIQLKPGVVLMIQKPTDGIYLKQIVFYWIII